MANPSPNRISLVLVIVLVAAMATGAAASILVGASTAAPPTSGPTSQVLLPLWVFLAGVFGLLAVIIVSWIMTRLTSEAKGVSNRVLVSVLLTILIVSLFIVGLRVFGVGGPPPPTSTTVISNTTNASGSTGSSPGNFTNLSGLGAYDLFPSIPAWVPFVVLGFVVLVLVIVVVPHTRRYLAERQERLPSKRGAAASPAGVRAALTRASAGLDLGEDPRTVILALYSEMLLHLQPMVGSVETNTPEEIRAVHLAHLGVRPGAARTLTRLFEEARYSLHPMGPKESARAQDAVRATLEDLDRRVPHA